MKSHIQGSCGDSIMHGKLARRLWQDDVEAMIDGSGSRLSCNVGPH